MKYTVLNFKTCLLAGLVLLVNCTNTVEKTETINPFGKIKEIYSGHLIAIDRHMDSIRMGQNYEYHLTKARSRFKLAEPILGFVENSDLKSLNRPNILAVKEEDPTDVKVLEPLGFQVLEELIYDTSVDSSAVNKNAGYISSRMKFLLRNANFDHYKDYHFLRLIRQGILRVATTGITGFDTPVLPNSLRESALAYEQMKQLIILYENKFTDNSLYQAWMEEIETTQKDLDYDFDTFDRYAFIKEHTDRQLRLWNQTVEDWNINFNLTFAINNTINTLFSPDAFNPVHFSDRRADSKNKHKVLLGRKLFNDRSLSRNGRLSCASCHESTKAFTDGLVLSAGQARNSPTLTYAGLQKEFFYDNRSGSLEGQIVSVMHNETEFHTDAALLVKTVSDNQEYRVAFDSLYKDGVTDPTIRNAIANYIRSLAPFNSKFDRNIRGEENTLTAQEIRGFNIFMGKGSCATCHFPPVFNGSVPPEYEDTEMELIGVPETAENLQVDDDKGRFDVMGTEERKFFFKTPTVRNVALTAPYMHNGVYHTLEEVMDFYNNGGGAGMGFELPLQTLPFDSLSLTAEEVEAVIAFMNTLTDKQKDQ